MEVSIRELKANPARAIALMQCGETVHITSHRKVVAELVAPTTTTVAKQNLSDEEALQKLQDSGAVAELPKKRFKLPVPVSFAPSKDGQSMSDLAMEMRGPS